MEIKGRVVFVTGGAGVLGKAIARSFLKRGAKVAVTDIDVKKGGEATLVLQKEFGQDRVKFIKCDVTLDEDFESAYDKAQETLGVVDILINNAGIAPNDWKLVTTINYGGVVRGTELAMKKMGKEKGGKGGHVINIGSSLGIADLPYIPFYSGSKAGVVHYTRCIGHPFHKERTGVIVQCLCPYGIDSELLGIIAENCYSPDSAEAYRHLIETNVLLKPKVVSEAAIKLLEDQRPGAVLTVAPGDELKYIEPGLKIY